MLDRFKHNELSSAQLFFEQNGFVIISDAFAQNLLMEFSAEVSNIIKATLCKAKVKTAFSGESVFDQAMETLEDIDHEYVAEIYDTIFQCPSFLRIISEPVLTETVRFLLGNKNAPLYGYTNRCRIDPPQDDRRTYGWHQEVFYTVPRGHYIQSWAPLVRDTSVATGTIRVAIGSHKEKIASQTWQEIDGRATQILIDDDVINRYPQVSVEMKLGELLLFSGFLAHQSGSNNSSHHRYSLVGMYHDVSQSNFRTPSVEFNFRGETPEEYFQSVMSNSSLKTDA
jgi:ectoine hydroxylase-related dioxygenase (phytanoyl-CoA dioxygenase family)